MVRRYPVYNPESAAQRRFRKAKTVTKKVNAIADAELSARSPWSKPRSLNARGFAKKADANAKNRPLTLDEVRQALATLREQKPNLAPEIDAQFEALDNNHFNLRAAAQFLNEHAPQKKP